MAADEQDARAKQSRQPIAEGRAPGAPAPGVLSKFSTLEGVFKWSSASVPL
jgi:hypothetical protein